MKKVSIAGVCKLEVYRSKNGDYSSIEVNGTRLETLLANILLQEDPNGKGVQKAKLCRVTISIESYPAALSINNVDMPLEL